MTERESLIKRLRMLQSINSTKQKKYQEDNGFGPEAGCLTRESLVIASLVPQMQTLGITMDDVCRCDHCKDWGMTTLDCPCPVHCPECNRPTWPNLGVNLPAGAAWSITAQ